MVWPEKLKRLRDDYRWQSSHRPPSPLSYKATTHLARTVDVLEKRAEVVLGIVLHSVLERLANSSLPIDNATYLAEQRPLWTAMAAGHDLTNDAIDEVVPGTATQIETVLGSDRGRWLLKAREDAHAELRVTGLVGERLENVVVDRTFLSEGTRWVVDYKTATPAGRDRQEFIRSEVGRYRPQLEKYATLVASLFEQPVITAIYFTAIGHLEIV